MAPDLICTNFGSNNFQNVSFFSRKTTFLAIQQLVMQTSVKGKQAIVSWLKHFCKLQAKIPKVDAKISYQVYADASKYQDATIKI